MEVAMKLLEKDIHEKQDTIVSLRRQLDDIKLINLEMYKKLQVRIELSIGSYLQKNSNNIVVTDLQWKISIVFTVYIDKDVPELVYLVVYKVVSILKGTL